MNKLQSRSAVNKWLHARIYSNVESSRMNILKKSFISRVLKIPNFIPAIQIA